MMYKSKLFTLIELIVVIVILGILAAIVIPNISSWQKESEVAAVQSNVRNLQTASDMYSLKNTGHLPGLKQPAIGVPQPIDYNKIHPDQLRNLPKTKGFKYWVDSWGTVWGSRVDSPTKVTNNGTILNWEEEEFAVKYGIYLEVNQITSSTVQSANLLKQVAVVTKEEYEKDGGYATGNTKNYYVSAFDEEGFESPPVNSNYQGYENMMLSPTVPDDSVQKEETPVQPAVNETPVAVITMSPQSSLYANTNITWNHANSIDVNQDSIVEAEWKVDGVSTTTPPARLTAGSHSIELRVKDSKGLWSDWTSKTITVLSGSKVGQALPNPEAGWKRYDVTNKASSYVVLANGWTDSYASCWGGTLAMVGAGNKVKFRFYGSKLRIMDGANTNRSTINQITIDGEKKTFSAYRSPYQNHTVVFEISLTLGAHEVEILVPSSEVGKILGVDSIDIDNNGYLLPIVGSAPYLTTEVGWKRIDDMDSSFKYNGNFRISTGDTLNYAGTMHWSDNTNPVSIEFKFKGTQLRLITSKGSSDSPSMGVTIDGVTETYSAYRNFTSAERMALSYEKTGLEDKEHTVVIANLQPGNWGFDAIELNNEGYLVSPSQ